MVVISDSDVVRKLAYCELLSEFLQLLKVPPNDIWVLAALKYQIRRSHSNCAPALLDFDNFYRKVKVIPAANLDLLARFDSLHEGEQQIFAWMCQTNRVEIVVTGDKDALKKLSRVVHKDPELGQMLTGDIWCLEGVMLRLIQKRGFGVVNARVHRWREREGDKMDATIARIFANGCTEASVCKALSEHVNTLKMTCLGIPLQV